MGESFELDEPDTFTAGALGRPGQRVFYLQARKAGASLSVRAEKQQVAVLAEYLERLLADLPSPGPLPHPDTLRLVEPVEAIWVVGGLGVAYDPADDRVLVVAEEFVAGQDEATVGAGPEPANLRLRVTREQAAAFARHVPTVVAAGRPACPLCGRPMDPDGHVCPRSNGHGVH